MQPNATAEKTASASIARPAKVNATASPETRAVPAGKGAHANTVKQVKVNAVAMQERMVRDALVERTVSANIARLAKANAIASPETRAVPAGKGAHANTVKQVKVYADAMQERMAKDALAARTASVSIAGPARELAPASQETRAVPAVKDVAANTVKPEKVNAGAMQARLQVR